MSTHDRAPAVEALGGGRYRLTARMWLRSPRERVFDFFSRAENLERITPALIGFRIVTPLPIEMRVGAVIDYRLKLRGAPMRWRTRITMWEPCEAFEDTQERGPYAEWVHRHTFAEVDGGTLCDDEVTYRPPGGRVLARAVNRLLVQRDVEAIFRYRQGAMRELLG